MNTLFLVDTQRLTAALGASAEATIMSDLDAVASGNGSGGGTGETGVVGAISPSTPTRACRTPTQLELEPLLG